MPKKLIGFKDNGDKVSKTIKNKKNTKISKKALPTQVGMITETFVQAPLPVSNNATELIKLNTGYVYDCSKLNAQSVASVPFKLYTTKSKRTKSIGDWVETKSLDKKEQQWIKQNNPRNINVKIASEIVEIVDHPFLDLMYAVSSSLDSFTLFEITEHYLGLLGNAYWYVKKDKQGIPQTIEVLPSEFISVKLDKEGKVFGYRFQPDYMGKFIDYDIDEIVPFKNPIAGAFRRISTQNVPIVGVYGMGHLEAVLDEVRLLNSINVYEKTLMDNNARMDFVVSYNGTLEDKTQQKLSRQWNQLFKGYKQSGKVAIMDNQFEIKTLNFSPKDLNYIEGKKWLRCAIMNAFGIDESFFTVENSNRASSQVAIEKYFRFTIAPKLRRLQESINQALLPLYDDNLYIQFDNCIPEDNELKIKQETSDIQNGIKTIDEIRVERGLTPFGGIYSLPILGNNSNNSNNSNIVE